MSTQPDQIRAQIDALLAPLPHLDGGDDGQGAAPLDVDLGGIARRLSEAHDVLVRALESVEKG